MNALIFLATLAVLVFIHELGHFLVAKCAHVKVLEFAVGFPPKIASFRRGETTYSLNSIPLGGFVRLLGEDDPSEDRSFAAARKRWRAAILIAGPFMNILAAWLVFSAAFVAGWPQATQVAARVSTVLPGSPAAQVGIQVNDLILTVDHQPLKSLEMLPQYTQDHLGRPMQLEVKRGNSLQEITVVPRTTWPQGEGPIGISMTAEPLKVDHVHFPVTKSLLRGGEWTLYTITSIPQTLALALRGLVPMNVLRPVGPVGLYQLTSDATNVTISKGWLFPLLSMIGTISAGLGIANMLPIPGLDGGRLLFVVIELVRGRRINPERERMAHLVGLASLLVLVLLVSYGDIVSPIHVDWNFG